MYGGVRVIKLRADPTGLTTGRFVVTGGADGYVNEWELTEVTGTRKDGTPLRGVNLKPVMGSGSEQKRYELSSSAVPYNASNPPMVMALDTHKDKPTEYIAGTVHCDIWEVDETPRILVEGHEDDIWRVATHPTKPNIFASTCESGKVGTITRVSPSCIWRPLVSSLSHHLMHHPYPIIDFFAPLPVRS